MWKRMLCFVLILILCFNSVGIVVVYAENIPSESSQATSSETVAEANAEVVATTVADATPEILNVTSGSVLLELGKSYQFVHDTVEIMGIYSFDSLISVQTGNVIVANEVGTTTLTLMYLNEINILSAFSCQVEILEISGTLDFARGIVYVEKGKNYRWIHSEKTVTDVSQMNVDISSLTHQGVILTAHDVGRANFSYAYEQDGVVQTAVFKVDVYENVDINSLKTNSSDNFYIVMSDTTTYMGSLFAITYNSDNGSHHPEMLKANYSRYNNQEYRIMQADDGYCYIYSPYHYEYLVVNDSEPALDSEIMFSSSLLFNGTQIHRWRFLRKSDNSLLLVPEGAENSQLFLSCQGALQNNKEYVLRSYTDTNAEMIWRLYNSNMYVNHYYDHSLNDEVGTDLMVIHAISEAGGFVNVAFSHYYDSMRIKVKTSPTYTPDSPADQCPMGVDSPCDDELCGTAHPHKNIDKIRRYMSQNFVRNNNELIVLWSDRNPETFCVHNASGCETSIAAGMTANNDYYGMLITMLSVREHLQHYYLTTISENDLNIFVSLLLAHEITHTLGLGDNYYRDSHLAEGDEHHYDSISCIMETTMSPSKTRDFYESIRLGEIEPLCDECYEAWKGNMYLPFFQGNCY